MIARSLSAIYCDDVRLELGNKMSYMGVYQTRLLLPSFPITLPKFCVAITAVTDWTNPFKSIAFKVLVDDNLIVEMPIDCKIGIESVPTHSNKSDAGSMCQIVGAVIVTAPFSMEKPSILRIRAQTETEELKAPALRIELAPQATS